MHCVCVLECERLQRQMVDATTQLSECRDQLATCRSQSADQQKHYDDLIVTRDETVHQLRDDSSRLQKRVNTASLPLARYIMLLLFATFCCLQPAVCLHRFGFVFCRQLLMWPTTVLYPLDRELQLRVQFLLRIFIAFLFRCGNIWLESRGTGSVWEVAALQSLLHMIRRSLAVIFFYAVVATRLLTDVGGRAATAGGVVDGGRRGIGRRKVSAWYPNAGGPAAG